MRDEIAYHRGRIIRVLKRIQKLYFVGIRRYDIISAAADGSCAGRDQKIGCTTSDDRKIVTGLHIFPEISGVLSAVNNVLRWRGTPSGSIDFER